jgi:peptidoglycan/xylan/chitin deacetylase (PgdA/CDA1 family)
MWRALFLRNKMIVLMYHEVMDDTEEIEAWTVVKKSAFILQMEYLKRHCRVVTLRSALDWMYATPARPLPPNVVLITFDDGYSGNAKCAYPVLGNLGLPATIFASTESILKQRRHWFDEVILALQRGAGSPSSFDLGDLGLAKYEFNPCRLGEARWTRIQALLSDLKRLEPQIRDAAVARICTVSLDMRIPAPHLMPMTPHEVKMLAASPLVTLGSHSHRHSLLVQLDENSLVEDLLLSKRLLAEWTGKEISYLSYPNGDHNDLVTGVTRNLGFTCAVTTEARPWRKSDSPLMLPRVGVGRYDSLDCFKAKVAGLWR